MTTPELGISEKILSELLVDLTSSDPGIRDGQSLGQLCGMIKNGALTSGRVHELGALMIERLHDVRVEVRSFAALVLGEIILSGALETEWFPQFAEWYSSEEDIEGFDETRGWLHAVAHGADALGAFGWTATKSPRPVLDLAARRMLHPGPTVWRDQEDDRLGFAIAVTLSNPHLTRDDSVGWLDSIERVFLAGTPGPVPPFASNAMRTLRVVYFLTNARIPYMDQETTILHSAEVARRLREVLHIVSPWMWTLESSS